MELNKNPLLLFLTLILYSVSACYFQGAKSTELFEYEYLTCEKSHLIKRHHVNDSIFVDSSFIKNGDILYTYSKTYKVVGEEWFYLSEDQNYLPWFSLDKFQKRDTLFFYRLPLSKFPLQTSTFAIPQRQEIHNNKPVYVFKIEEPNEIPRIKPLEYYFDFDVGVVKIIDNQESEGCKEAQLVVRK